MAIDAGDNAYLVICVEVDTDLPHVEGGAYIKRVELPEGFDLTSWTYEQLLEITECP